LPASTLFCSIRKSAFSEETRVWGVGCGGAGEQGGFKEVFLSFITGGAPPVRLLSRNTGCGVWGVGEQGGFKEVFLSFIAGGVPPVRLLSEETHFITLIQQGFRDIVFLPYVTGAMSDDKPLKASTPRP